MFKIPDSITPFAKNPNEIQIASVVGKFFSKISNVDAFFFNGIKT